MDAGMLGYRIDVAREPAFHVGGVQIDPAACALIAGDRRIHLQRRVMQVLVALAKADGSVVPREVLSELCWGEINVGDDALNRCIQRLRRLADIESGGGFQIETIPRVGYRLTFADSRARTTPPTPTPVLAVLPFDNLSVDTDLLYFSDGVSEDLQRTLAQRVDLKVVGRTSSFQFRGQGKVLARIAAELGATHVLDGSVRRSGLQIRVSAQLIDCQSHTTLWAGRFDRALTDIFAVQDEIAAAIASALNSAFAPAKPFGKIDPVAYDLYLRSRGSGAAVRVPIGEAISLLERAVEMEPRLAAAWATLSHRRALVNRRSSLDDVEFEVPRAQVIAAAERALQLDPGCGLAYAALGLLLPWGDYEGRETALERALAAGPRDPQTAIDLGWFLSSVGRNREALRCAAHSLELDPLNNAAANLYGQVLACLGRYAESQDLYSAYRNRGPHIPALTIVPLNLAAMAGDRATYDRLRPLAKRLDSPGAFVAQALKTSDRLIDPRPDGAGRMHKAILAQFHRTGVVTFGPLVLAYKMGLSEEIFAIVKGATFDYVFEDDGPPPAGYYSPGLLFDVTSNHEMMRDVRIVDICAKVGLCAYWLKTDRWPDCADGDALPYDFRAECRRAMEAIAAP